MLERVRLWLKLIKSHPVITLLIPLLVALFLTILIGGYRLNWAWTGFTGEKETYKTLYDWMQLLFIPVVLAAAGFWFNHRERKAAELRTENEHKAAELRAQADREIEQQRAKAEREIAEDNQREAALQAYINEMSNLLLEKKLRESTVADEVRTIARVRTLTVLPRLDSNRKRNLLLFLFDAGLIDRKDQIIDIGDADFSEADLSGVDLCLGKWIVDSSLNERSITTAKADLSGANLRNANLTGANLSGVKLGVENEFELEFGYPTKSTIIADLSGAKLVRANLREAVLGGVDLHGADLSKAILVNAYLQHADLSCANLHGADLSIKALLEELIDNLAPDEDQPDTSGWVGVDLCHADLSGADLSDANLWQADLQGANLRGADLSGANLKGANLIATDLRGAIITSEQLKQAKSLKRAIMPDGSINP